MRRSSDLARIDIVKICDIIQSRFYKKRAAMPAFFMLWGGSLGEGVCG